MVDVAVLGTLSAMADGRALELGGPRQRAVLARLVAAGGQVVSTDRFVDDLWAGEPPPKALAALQVYVSNLRRALEPDRAPRTPAAVLVSTAPGYALRLATAGVDAWRFEQLVTRAAGTAPARAVELLDEALGLWSGPAYAEFADASWAAPEAGRLEELRLVAVERRVEAHLALGTAGPLIPGLEQHVRSHPLREDAVRLLALALYRAGRQGDALALLRSTRRRLSDELGIDPGPALRTVEADILAQAPALRPSAPPVSPAPEHGPEPALVGRAAELAALHRAASAAAGGTSATGATTGRFGAVWLGGEAGAGKTTLADAFTGELSAQGWQVVWGRCPEVDGAPPAWAWTEVLGRLTGETTVEGGGFRLAQALTRTVRAVDGPLAVVLDDVHRADGETLQLLRFLAAELAARPVLVLATHRPSEVTDALATTWAALAGPAADRLDLPGLSADESAALLRRYADIDDATAALVADRTGGNPLFVAETARLIATEGSSAARTVVPAGVRDVLRRRMSRLPDSARTVLRNAAVIGRDIDVDVLLALAVAPEDEVLDGLEAGVLAGLLSEPHADTVRFTHALVRDTLYDDTPRLRRVRTHARVLAALEERGGADVATLAHHALAGATGATAAAAAGYAAAAARQAAGLRAHREAAELWRAGLDALDRAGHPDPSGRLDLLCGLISAQAHAGDVLAARTTRERAVKAASEVRDPLAAARPFTAWDAPVTWTVRQDRAVDWPAVAAVEQVLADLPAGADPVRSRVLSALVFELEGDDVPRCETASAEAIALARRHFRPGDPESAGTLCMALNGRFFVALEPSHRGELTAIGTEMLSVASAAGLPGFQMQAHHVLAMSVLDDNDLDAAQRHWDAATEWSGTGQLKLAMTILSMFGAMRALIRGDLAEAEAAYTGIAERMAAEGGPNAAAIGALGRFFVRLAAGRTRESLPELEMFYQRLPDDVADLYVRALLDDGRPDEARALWRPDVPIRRDYYWLLWAALRAEDAALLGDRDTAAVLYGELLPWRSQFAGMHNGSMTSGPVEHNLGDLALLLGRPDDAAAHYRASSELCRRIGAPVWAGRAESALAALGR